MKISDLTDYTIENYVIDDIENVPLIGILKIDATVFGRLDIVINKYYQGEMAYLPILRAFNGITDDTQINIGSTLRLPNIDALREAIVINTIADDDNVPGIVSSCDSRIVNKATKISPNNSKTSATKLGITLKKVNYDSESGVIVF